MLTGAVATILADAAVFWTHHSAKRPNSVKYGTLRISAASGVYFGRRGIAAARRRVRHPSQLATTF